ncbi:MAG: hypothetical protein AAB152_08475 [Candidatus Coatesbacteria bacterium]
MTCKRRLFAFMILATAGGSAVAGASPIPLVPFLDFSQGVNSNPGTIPDETPTAARPRADTFTLIQPGAGLGLVNGPVFKAGLRYQAEWERYDQVREGDTVSHHAMARMRWGSGATSANVTLGYSHFAFPRILGADDQPVLDHDAARIGLELMTPLASGDGLGAFLEASAEARSYPHYLVVTNGEAPGDLSRRSDRTGWGAIGVSFSKGDAAGMRVAAEAGDTVGNGLASQSGEWGDFFSYHALGARVSGWRTFSRWPVRLEGVVRYQRRSSVGRIATDEGDLERSDLASLAGSATWSLGRGIGLTADLGVLLNKSNDPQTSFRETRFAVGLRLMDLLFGEEAVVAPQQASTPSLEESEVNRLYDEARGTYDRGSFARCVSLTEDLLRLVPNFWQGWSLLGSSLYADGDTIEAYDAYQRSLELNPENPELREWLSRVRSATPAVAP